MRRCPSLCAVFLASWLVLDVIPVNAYDLRTHEQVTARAFDAALEASQTQGLQQYLNAVGISPADTFTVEPPTPPDQLDELKNTGTVRDWMREGAIREDDFRTDLCFPPQNPASSIDRPLHHFSDVQRGGRGLTVLGSQRGFPAPDWALGLQGRDQNQFSLLDARDYQFQSLTAPTRDERDRNTARLFRALGQVVHVLEDMAAPQHTRNDPHAGCETPSLIDSFVGEHSWYEAYIETRARGERFRSRGVLSPPLVLDGHAPVSLGSTGGYRDFFTSAQGLAEFSSRNFFSAGTNLGWAECGGLSQPVCTAGSYQRSDTNFSILTQSGTIVSGRVTLYLGNVVDALTGETIPNVPLSSRSLWDQHLERWNFLPTFSLNTLNYDAAADLLVPRAVGYAAGLLNYFFRGQIAVETEGKLLRITNVAPGPNPPPDFALAAEATGGETMDGVFTLYYETEDGSRNLLTSFTLQLTAGGTGEVQVPAAPEDPTPVRCLLVFRGQLGLEPDAVVGSVMACPTAAEPPPPPPPPREPIGYRHVLGCWYVDIYTCERTGETFQIVYYTDLQGRLLAVYGDPGPGDFFMCYSSYCQLQSVTPIYSLDEIQPP